MKKTEVSLNLPDPGDFQSCYIFGIHKSGSTLMNNMIKDICNECKMPFVAPAEQLFTQGFLSSDLVEDMNALFYPNGFVYLGFRYFWKKRFSVKLNRNKCILLVRDPRDALVSLYYSTKYSHGIPKTGSIRESMQALRNELQNVEIEEYFKRDNIINDFADTHERYYYNLPRCYTRIYRYEDVVFFKREWLHDMTKFLEIKIAYDKILEIANKYDIIPEKEQNNKFVRQVLPGNHRKHLSEATICKLNERFSHVLQWYGYNKVPYKEF